MILRTKRILRSTASPLRRHSRFTDPRAIEKEDLAHSTPKERRLWRTGKLKTGLVVTGVYTLKGDRIRLISAQERRRERREYEQAKK